MNVRTGSTLGLVALTLALNSRAADIPGSKDPAGVKRYTGSEIIGYHAPKFDEFLLPLGPPTELSPPAFAKSLKTEGLISRYTYLAPAGSLARRIVSQLSAPIHSDESFRLPQKLPTS